MRVLILEDEAPARAQLVRALHQWNAQVEIVGELTSVVDARHWMRTESEPDLILADIRLSDGRSMQVFEHDPPNCPIVFVTAYSEHTQEALVAGGIDYVLKPVDPERLARALDKVMRLQAHFGASSTHRQRLLVRRGSEIVTVLVQDVAWFCTEHRLVFAVCRDGRRHVVDQSLQALQDELDPRSFFRIHRSWLVHIDAVQGFKSHGKGRLLASLTGPAEVEAVVSAQHAAAFRAWLDR